MFIESQKRKIDNEKRELNKAKAIYSPRDDGIVSILLVLFPVLVCFKITQRKNEYVRYQELSNSQLIDCCDRQVVQEQHVTR